MLAAADGKPSSRATQVVEAQTVLVVQGNPHLRKSLKVYFQREGHRVLEADSSTEAARVAGGVAPVALLLTDFKLTDGSGLELFVTLRKHHPDLLLLVTIGHPQQRAAIPLEPGISVIAKPFDLRDFGQLVSRLLAPART